MGLPGAKSYEPEAQCVFFKIYGETMFANP